MAPLEEPGRLQMSASPTAPQTPVEGTQRGTPRQNVGGQEAVEGVARPRELQAVLDEGNQRNVIHAEAGIVHDRPGELGIADREPPDLREKLDLQERHWGDTPWSIPVEPRELGEAIRSED